jgi:hypothetical protein
MDKYELYKEKIYRGEIVPVKEIPKEDLRRAFTNHYQKNGYYWIFFPNGYVRLLLRYKGTDTVLGDFKISGI